MTAPASPKIERRVSNIGKAAVFGTPDEEVNRILQHKSNYYVVLKVLKDSDASEIKINHRKLSLLVHPDKCSHPQAADASACLNQAKDTLTNPLKKALYDQYVKDATDQTGDAEVTYAEWEAAQSMQPVQLPAWLERLLRIPVVGQIIILILLLLLLPLLLILLVLGFVLWLLCLPISCLCGGAAKDAAGGEDAAGAVPGAAPEQQTASRVAVEQV